MALSEVNRIILDLRPTLLEDMGLLPALRWYASQRLEPLGVSVHVQTGGVDGRLPPHAETTAYRIAQKAVTNVAKHAGARNLWLADRRGNRHLTLSIRDNGCGFDPGSVLGIYPDIEVVGEAADGLETLAQVDALHPDVVLLDLAMSKLGGLDVLRSLHRDHPECRLLVLTQHEAPDYVLPALQAGARGYLLKRAGGTEVVQAVRAVARGESFLHTAVTQLVIESVRAGTSSGSSLPDGRLSGREREVLALIAEGHTNGKIGKVLGISAKTVDKHRASLMEKLGIRTRSGLIRYALQGRTQ